MTSASNAGSESFQSVQAKNLRGLIDEGPEEGGWPKPRLPVQFLHSMLLDCSDGQNVVVFLRFPELRDEVAKFVLLANLNDQRVHAH